MKKKILVGAGILLLVLLLGVLLIPVIFKDDIKAAVRKQLAQYIAADVFFDADKFSVSLISDFPHLNARLDDFGVVNRAPFAGDTLLAVRSFRLSLDLWSVLFGNEMKVRSIQLIEPRIHALVNAQGQANWDIFLEQPADTLTEEEAAPLALAIDEWRIENGYIVYDDRSLPMYVRLSGVNHLGSGNLQADVFDMITQTEIAATSVAYDGVEYMSDKKVNADITMGIDLAKSQYTFKDNLLTVNEFPLHFEGSISMPDTNIVLDLRYNSPKTDFKKLLSLVPGVYSSSFEGLKAAGSVQFEGAIKGTYNAVQMPGFSLLLAVKDGEFQYPQLPTAVRNVQVDLKVENPDGDLEKTLIDLKQFHMDLGKNPVDIRLRTKGLATIDMDVLAKMRLNLADLTSMFPMEGVQLKGVFSLDATAKGTYGGQQMPTLDAQMSLSNAYVKTAEVPKPLENLNLQASLQSDGTLPGSSFHLQQFTMLFDGEPIEMSARVQDFDKVNFEVKAKGKADLAKLTKLYPLEDMQLAGNIDADLSAKGNMQLIKQEKYDQLDFAGYARLSNFRYLTSGMPEVRIQQAAARISPKEIMVEQMTGTAGKSDFQLVGTIANYMAYVFHDAVLRGKMHMESNHFDVNEWMTEEENPQPTPTAATAEPDTVDLAAIAIPKNLDFVFDAKIKEVVYDNLTLQDLVGKIVMRDGKVLFENVSSRTMGGQLLLTGVYDTSEPYRPFFDFSMKIAEIQISEAYKSLVTVQRMAPLAAAMRGAFSSDLRLAGVLGSDLMPKFETLSGGGLIAIIRAALQETPVLSQISAFTKMSDLTPMNLQDVIMKIKIDKGRVHYEPFVVKNGDRTMTISGSNGFDGSLDFVAAMDVPAGAAGQAVQGAVNQLIGTNALSGDRLLFDIEIGGTYDKPKIKVKPRTSTKETVKEVAKEELQKQKEAIQQVVEEKKQELEQQVKQEADKVKQEVEEKAKEEADKLKNKVKENVKDKLPIKLP
ncbi:uncharacterized protein involved in outer membrane biogenesis [Thermonema lapsum]|uniref:Uncharacterized protein involved in outer membrane biogenesis n=1 Tax=Thermonema lapsum TaxID=28195 RepID=A0A846MTI0_9BACT|nr:AsmA-like C-terminal region-containing protein [Thermonema lapsum]NIK74610.1 uncharacterized protein involved in outer membrane biogenesis [Thermonema lapsum]